MNNSKNILRSGEGGCLVWIFIIFMIAAQCDTDDKVEKLEKQIIKLEQRYEHSI